MEMHEIRDQIIIEDDDGNEKEYNVEALFDMADESYALLSSNEEVILMRIEEYEDEQTLVGVTNPEEKASILSAYALAVEADRDPNIISD
ncbi:DUF1292 domain-containing protein [Anaerobacillus isosaccharinicus]|uniref:DUF1292 domain-containing protein n=1 Tax=Anaerobacillus isosaccharinicus TaxID=1532552 RepID=A0A1S2KXD5_9BACI|nr:DUF1292 domain-containing protein [Anaerobacillus isosaccharinicus]MBA5586797.1 DUF1292 domain-containing protein [Anaerobacillus isosaccharinicus]QOY34987.1 DUF1292 domain-containing protein [Anaerobacillus isosaccharinicus]